MFEKQFVLKVGQVKEYGEGKEYSWVRCCQGPDGAIYLWPDKRTFDGGKTVVTHTDDRWRRLLRQFNTVAGGENYFVSTLCRPGLFLALSMEVDYVSSGVYAAKGWRSTDNLQTGEELRVTLRIPDGPSRKRKPLEWYGLYFYRSIVEMPDGSLLATVEGNFDSDRVPPVGRRNRAEIPSEDSFKLRTAVVRSTDAGDTWEYLSTVAYPQPDDDAVGEGFAEPTMVLLDNGQLLCVMRSGNYTPLYSAWSSDGGQTWTGPIYTGLERGLDPCLLKLRDGRVLLSYGMRFPAGWPGGPGEAGPRSKGDALVKLALSADGTGRDWVETTIGNGLGSAYSTMYELDPILIFCQVDGLYWRVMLTPRIPDTL